MGGTKIQDKAGITRVLSGAHLEDGRIGLSDLQPAGKGNPFQVHNKAVRGFHGEGANLTRG